VGVIWLGLGWYRLSREITSIAEWLKSDDQLVAPLVLSCLWRPLMLLKVRFDRQRYMKIYLDIVEAD
jgi:hypothetical protein